TSCYASGFVFDAKSTEPCFGVLLIDSTYDTRAYTNAYGFFRLKLENSNHLIHLISPNHEEYALKFSCQGPKEEIIYLKPIQIVNEVQARAKSKDNHEYISINTEKLRYIPTLLGERDLLKSITYLPGISNGLEGSSNLIVRGGGSDQNLILLDGAPVYNVNHLFGFISTFHSSTISNVTVYKGSFPSKYSGRVASVIDIRMKEGSLNKFRAEAMIGFLSSSIFVESPIKKDTSSFFVGARRTYLDVLLLPFRNLNNSGTSLNYFFYDLNLKYQKRLSTKDQIYMSLYLGRDKGAVLKEYIDDFNILNAISGIKWGNTLGMFRWNHLFKNKTFLNTSAIVTNYKYRFNQFQEYSFGDESFNNLSQLFSSGITDYSVKTNFENTLNNKNEIEYGLGSIVHVFKPSSFQFTEETNIGKSDTSFVPGNEIVMESYAFGEYTRKIKNGFLRIGMNLTSITQNKFKLFPQPRVYFQKRLSEKLVLKTGVSKMVQTMHLLSNQSIGLPIDYWIPATNDINPVLGWECNMALGISLKKIKFSNEIYYRKTKGDIQFKDGVNFFSFSENLVNKINTGQGWNYGNEFFVEKIIGDWKGTFAYTLSWAERQFDNYNNSRKFFYTYDRRNDVALTLTYSKNKDWRFDFTFVYQTGRAVTFGNILYQTNSNYATDLNLNNYMIQSYDQVNNLRMPNYHRMDFGVTNTKKLKRLTREICLGIYNVYNRKNAYFIYLEKDYQTNEYKLFQVSYLPFLPSVTWKYIFEK
ncbi:MAG: TonB-dependent receptor plug domain-containing protein, partial [Bacteroidetes bacterium]|nr:TonB-dependent receptor plug domain-containing protein [Bacteroidota bacterium]